MTTFFDFCRSLPETKKCRDESTLSVEVGTDFSPEEFQAQCINLTKNKGKNQEATLIEAVGEGEFEIKEHLRLDFSTEEECNLIPDVDYYGISFEVFCDASLEKEPAIVLNEALSNDCNPYFSVTHKSGCMVGDLKGIWRFVEDNAFIFAIVFIVVGLFNLILGRKLIKPAIAIIFCLSTVVAILFFLYVLILQNDSKEWVLWLLLAVSVILGGIVGFFASKFVRIGVFFLGLWAGAGIGLLLNNMVFYKINHVAVLWVLMAVFGLTLGILSIFWYHYIVIVCTSIIGSFLFIRGISLFAGGYPNEFTIYERIRDGELNGMPWTFYIYMIGMVILFFIGAFIQHKIKKREGDSEDKKYDYYKRV